MLVQRLTVDVDEVIIAHGDAPDGACPETGRYRAHRPAAHRGSGRAARRDRQPTCVADSLAVCRAMFNRYRQLAEAGQGKEAERYRLYGVRLDTSGSLRDKSVPPLGD